MATCYPDPDDWDALRVDLTSGERYLAEYLIQNLPEACRLYLQPHVGGTRPDLVLVHPQAGVQIIEVKDYDLGAYDLSGTTWKVRTGDGLQGTRSPFEQVDKARDALFRILLPFAEEARQEDTSLYGFVRAGVYFHNASSTQLEHLRSFARRSIGSDAKYYGIASQRALEEGGADVLMPLFDCGRKNTHVETIKERAEEMKLDRSWHEILHEWLHPTPDEALQNEPLKLTSPQEQAATEEAQRLLVTGPAGSGKTLVLARRAARHLLNGESVILLGFNITLWHYIRDFVARGLRAALRKAGPEDTQSRYTAAMRRLRITHYHELAFRMLGAIGVDKENTHPREAARLLVEKADSIKQRLETGEPKLPEADALLIDEGQDCGPNWITSLRPLLRERASITVAADPEQQIYDHTAEDPSMLFETKPEATQLQGTARVPAALLPALNTAADRWLNGVGGDLEKARQVSMDFSERPAAKAIWTTAKKERFHNSVVAAVRKRALEGVNLSQIAVLVPTHEEGLALEDRFEAAGMDSCSLCVEDPDQDRSRKHAFWRLDSRLKLSTVHSFKGWEADVVVVLLTQMPPSPEEKKVLHVALTRTRAVVQVVAPPGATDLPAWNHQTGQALLEEVPLSEEVLTCSLEGPAEDVTSGGPEDPPSGEMPEPPSRPAPHPVERMD